MSGVEGETIIVRGAAKGIGRGEAELLAASRILIRRNAQRSQKAIGVRAVFLCHGVLSATDWQKVVAETKKRFGRIDGLVNDVGIYWPASIAETTDFKARLAARECRTR